MTADQTPDSAPAPPRKLWRATLFLVGSLALSGITLALWNRGELFRLRNHREETAPAEPPMQVEEEVY